MARVYYNAILFGLLWIVSIILCTFSYDKKDKTSGFLIGFIFGPMGLLVILIRRLFDGNRDI